MQHLCSSPVYVYQLQFYRFHRLETFRFYHLLAYEIMKHRGSVEQYFLTVCHSDTSDMAWGHKMGFKLQFCCLLKAPRAIWELSRTTGFYRCCNHIECVRKFRGRDSSVGIATRYGLDCPRIESRWGGGGRDFPQPSRPALRPTRGTGSLLGVKRPGRDVDHPPSSSA
jgi:hypothetical protein